MKLLIAARLSQLSDGQTGLDTQDAESTAWAEREGHEVVHVAVDRKTGTSPIWDRKNLRPWVTEDARLAATMPCWPTGSTGSRAATMKRPPPSRRGPGSTARSC